MDLAAPHHEIDSGRMYFGLGPTAMLVAAAWDELATELRRTADYYLSVISGNSSEGCLGPASPSMATTLTSLAAQMSTTAARAEQAGAQAKAEVRAYEAALANTVPPQVIATNRSLSMFLIANNILGQNTPAIATTEAHYGEMCAQNAAAMYGYASSSATASPPTPITRPLPTTCTAGPVGQGATAAQAGGTHAQTVMSMDPQVIAAMPQMLQRLAFLTSSMLSGSGMSSNSLMTMLSSMNLGAMTDQTATSRAPMGALGTDNAADPTAAGPRMGMMGPASLVGMDRGGAAVSAGMGRATSVGALSVPHSWRDHPNIGPRTASLLSTGLAPEP
jgi:PPE-repeat protein